MANPKKRRKFEHVNSDEEADDGSFASFSDSMQEESNESRNIRPWSANNQAVDNDESLSGSGERDIDEDALVASSAAELHRPKQPSTARKALGKVSRASTGDPTAYDSGSVQNNLFKMQIDGLLESLRPRQGSKEAIVQEAMAKIKHTIERIPGRQGSVEEASRELLTSSNIAVPFPDPQPLQDAKYILQFAKPENSKGGRKAFQSSIHRKHGRLEAGLYVQMPSSIFQEKDYMNYRYFYKRAYYLACIAGGLKQYHNNEFDFHFQDADEDRLKPTLIVSPRSSPGDLDAVALKWRIRILPCTSENVFAPEKLLLNKNCVRITSDSRAEKAGVAPKQVPTPFYNSSVRSDMTAINYNSLFERLCDQHAAFQDACSLADAWLQQRGFGSCIHRGGFGSFEFKALMALLLKVGDGTRPFQGEMYSSYQLLKLALQLIASKDFSKEPFADFPNDRVFQATSGVPVAWDSTRNHNILYKMTPWSYRTLRQEARTTLTILGSQHFDGFKATFVTRVDWPLLRFDYVLELNASVLAEDDSARVRAALQDHHKLYNVLHRGLGDRVSTLVVIPRWSESWEVGRCRPGSNVSRILQIGFVVVPETVSRTVDHGPSAEAKVEAASFRKFWGEKAELRRFKDGSILESLVWEGNARDQSVFEQIVRYVLSRQFGSEAEQSLKVVGDVFRGLLPQASKLAAFEPLMEAYKQLEVDIRSLDDLPLSVRQLMPNDPKLRYAAAVAQQQPADITIQFEGSARWPDDLIAIQRTKIAFLLMIGEQLQASMGSVTTRAGMENEEHDSLNQCFLDIRYESGAAFRLRIHHEREQTLLERHLKDKALGQREKEVAAMGLATYKRDYVKAPAFTQAIARLCSRYPALSGAVRVTKKWFDTHLLSRHVAEEVIEIFVARVFVHPWPWQVPSSVQTGFLRTLSWLARWDWHNEPLIVDLSISGELKSADIQALRRQFEAWRKLDPGLNRVVFFCGSNVDPDGTAWTDGRTPKVVAARMTALAQAACAEVEAKQLKLNPASLFSSPLSDFDFIIHLTADAARSGSHSNRSRAHGAGFKNLELNDSSNESKHSYNVAHEFMQELDTLYGSAALFLYGGSERACIAGLWNPQTAPRPWKMHLAYSTTPTLWSNEDDVQAKINNGAILAEIARVGGDIVKSVEVNRLP